MQKFDIAIIGAALTGVVTAAALISSNSKLNIAIINKQADKPPNKHYIAINAGTADYLKQIKIWDICANLCCSIDNIHIGENNNIGLIELDHKQHNKPLEHFGYVLESQAAVTAILQHLQAKQQIKIFNTEATSVKRYNTHQEIDLASQATITSSLIIAADGQKSIIAKDLNLELTTRDFKQTAIISQIETDQHHHQKAYEIFDQGNSFALLPLQTKTYNMIWIMKAEQANTMLQLTTNKLITQIQNIIKNRAGEILQINNLQHHAITSQFLNKNYYHRTIFLGNCAQTLHPIAGQGFNLIIRDIKQLAAIISQAEDCGDYTTIKKYTTTRTKDRKNTLNATHHIVDIFASDKFSDIALRNAGLSLINAIPSLKYKLIKIATGT